jgi:hypothetical protein
MRHWRIQSGIERIRLATKRAARLAAEDLYGTLKTCSFFEALGLEKILKRAAAAAGIQSTRQVALRAGESASSPARIRPIIFVSACEGEAKPGGWKWCGGIKELNHLVKLLRMHGYEAYMVTWDGTYEPWLIDHQPNLSLGQYREKLTAAAEVRCVTSLISAQAFIAPAPAVYFWDMELASTEHFHFPILARLHRAKKIHAVAAISRTIQAWHMAHFEMPATVIAVNSDSSIWFPVESARRKSVIGYLNEGDHTGPCIDEISRRCAGAGLDLQFVEFRGDEMAILDHMRGADVFLGMNLGKDPLWGEGCPLSTVECMSVGCVMVAFDVIGNREIVNSGFNGILVPPGRADAMAAALIDLYKTPGLLEQMRTNSLAMIRAIHTLEHRWPAVKAFLNLPYD